MDLQAEFGFELSKEVEGELGAGKAVISLEFIARYPFIEEAGRFLKKVRNEALYEEVADIAAGHILDAIRLGEVREHKSALYELLSKPVANAMIIYYDDNWLKSRYAEARRVERRLRLNGDAALQLLLERILYRVARAGERDEARREYKMPFLEFLRAEKYLLPELRLRLVNPPIRGGYIYLNKAEAIRLIRGYYQRRLLNIFGERRPRSASQRIRDAAERHKPEIRDALRLIYEIRKEVWGASGMPPCIKVVLAKIRMGYEVTYMERFTAIAYLLNKGSSVEEVLELFKGRADYDEKVARYEAELAAGLKGSGTRYKPPPCERLRVLGMCIDGGRRCPSQIGNPLRWEE
ncbi:MAG: hypothetical protein DRN61_02780 [Thaumarchaeota archaeon]|nr:MAG: hypothetical protein DRN61_02780 [Nitrososphaerota archaeon]